MIHHHPSGRTKANILAQWGKGEEQPRRIRTPPPPTWQHSQHWFWPFTFTFILIFNTSVAYCDPLLLSTTLPPPPTHTAVIPPPLTQPSEVWLASHLRLLRWWQRQQWRLDCRWWWSLRIVLPLAGYASLPYIACLIFIISLIIDNYLLTDDTWWITSDHYLLKCYRPPLHCSRYHLQAIYYSNLRPLGDG